MNKIAVSPQVKTFTNPILPGFYPDPSICRVGGDYYLVTSSFSYFPGLPIFHSPDLVNWKQLGHVLDRPSQLDLDGVGHSHGIFAPTIRYFNRLFYVITTNVTKGGNFIVTAENPAGPWSEPYWLDDAPGIDPSLFFDDDGRAYCTGTHEVPEGGQYYGDNEIWLRELDLNKMTLTGPRYGLWRGALKKAIWAEGPHLYKINGMYYLMISEGGTDYHHAVTIARSSQLMGPYEGNPANPILTHRHLGRSSPIVNTGHADIVETQHGEWWMVALASRPYGGYYRNLGRETFLVPVQWEDGWPIVSPGTGRIEFEYPCPRLEESSKNPIPNRDDFDGKALDAVWNTLRTPREQFWDLQSGYLKLMLRNRKLNERATPSFIGRRQQHFNFSASAAMEFIPCEDGDAAGLTLMQSNEVHYRFEYTRIEGKDVLRLVRCFKGEETELAQKEFCTNRMVMKISANEQNYCFLYGVSEKELQIFAENIDGRMLSTDVAGGFVGTYIGMFACCETETGMKTADFDWFTYHEERQG